LKSKPKKKPAKADIKLSSILEVSHSTPCLSPASAAFFIDFFFDPENGGDMVLRNVGLCSI
jgi:hypothetical protein